MEIEHCENQLKDIRDIKRKIMPKEMILSLQAKIFEDTSPISKYRNKGEKGGQWEKN